MPREVAPGRPEGGDLVLHAWSEEGGREGMSEGHCAAAAVEIGVEGGGVGGGGGGGGRRTHRTRRTRRRR